MSLFACECARLSVFSCVLVCVYVCAYCISAALIYVWNSEPRSTNGWTKSQTGMARVREREKVGSEESSMQSLWQEVASLHCAAAAVLPFRPHFISLSPAPALASTCLAEAHYKSLPVSPCSSQCLPKIHDFVAATAASTRATHAHSHTDTNTVCRFKSP